MGDVNIPDFSFEKLIWERGFLLVIGVDEVGRGAFAGPVVAGACAIKIMNHESRIKNNEKEDIEKLFLTIEQLGINDSKKVSEKKRLQLDPLIKKYFHFSTAETSVEYINRFGIKKATERAFRQVVIKVLYNAVSFLQPDVKKSAVSVSDIENAKPYLLLDAFKVKYVPIIGLTHQQNIIKGDQKSITIAAASIVAKVYRDTLMDQLSPQFPLYTWHRNKGYGTDGHRKVIKEKGLTIHHRVQFCQSSL